jgi:hypothetical protein
VAKLSTTVVIFSGRLVAELAASSLNPSVGPDPSFGELRHQRAIEQEEEKVVR